MGHLGNWLPFGNLWMRWKWRHFTGDKPVALVQNVRGWKRAYVANCFSEFHMIFMNRFTRPAQFDSYIRGLDSVCFIIWGYGGAKGTLEYAKQHSIPVYRMEDGFIRSVGLGAAHVLPRSLVLDKSGVLYFDARQPSGLEQLLREGAFKSDARLMVRATSCLERIVQEGLSKYNFVRPKGDATSIFDKYQVRQPGKRRILVIGQVEADASLLYGRAEHMSNLALVERACAENPDDHVFFKPHPDVLKGYARRRATTSRIEDIESIAHVVTDNIPLHEAFLCVDHVYTLTSLAGFEAVLRGVPVTVFGRPFYSGWGLTDDRHSDGEQKGNLTKEELFAGAYLVYPKYFDVETGGETSLEQTIEAIIEERAQLTQTQEERGR